MKSISGKALAKLVERHGWTCFEFTAAITSTEKPERCAGYPSRSTAMRHSS
jgi:hypothetical protein